jgi:hypothetical protein
MPKHKKKSKQEKDEDFDDMLAGFHVADLATNSNAASNIPATVDHQYREHLGHLKLIIDRGDGRDTNDDVKR